MELPEQRRAHRRRRLFRLSFFALLTLFALWLVLILLAAGRVTASALDGKEALERARAAAEALDFSAARADLERADRRFGEAETGFAFLRTARFLPFVSDQVEAADALLLSGRQVVVALEPIVELGAELVRLTGFSEEEIRQMGEGVAPSVTFDELSPETKRAILERLAASADDLRLLSARLAVARFDLERIDRDSLVAPAAAALEPLDARLAEAQSVIDALSVGAQILPEFAGLGRERAHLLLFLNNTELRPGGGFIGTYGILKTLDGDIRELETHDSYVLDRPAEPFVAEVSPEPLRRYLAADRWFFRDANWSPDFPSSAANAVRLYGMEAAAIPPDVRAAAGIENPSFDGVIGVTPTFLEDLLAFTGPVTVGGQTFDAENVTDRLEYQVEVGYAGQGIPEAQRKEVVADLVNALKARLFSTPLSRLPPLLELVSRSFEEKHLAVMSHDAAVSNVLRSVDWDGAVAAPPAGTDAQMVVDANLASLKTDPKVAREIHYEIFRNTGGQYVGRTTVRYRHHGTFDWKTTRYRTYVRLYVPVGSDLIRVDGSMLVERLHDPEVLPAPVDVVDELGFTSFGTFVSVEPGETRDLVFEYRIADSVVRSIENGTYSLDVFKQMGAANHALTLRLDFDKNVKAASIPEDRGEWGDDAYVLNTKLDQDLEVEVGL